MQEIIFLWQSKGISEKSIKSQLTAEYNFAAKTTYTYGQISIQIDGICFGQYSISFLHRNVVYIACCLPTRCMTQRFKHRLNTRQLLTLFEAVKLTNNSDCNKYGSGFMILGSMHTRNFGGRMVNGVKIIFGLDNSCNNINDILVLGESPA